MAEPVKFECTSCGGHIIIDGEPDGGTVICPHCGATLQLPGAEADCETEPRVEPPPPLVTYHPQPVVKHNPVEEPVFFNAQGIVVTPTRLVFGA